LRRRVLILDFDFFSTVGGGQVFYRRVVERNPGIDFFYPSSGADSKRTLRGDLPPNAYPVLYDPKLDVPVDPSPQRSTEHWIDNHHKGRLSSVASAFQGMTFQAVDIPSYFPVAHLVRPTLTAYGITVERVALGLVGWQTVSVRNGYVETDAATLERLDSAESNSLASADVRYTISNLEQKENGRTSLPIVLLDMKDTIESFPPPAHMPPGEGAPDLWYVGRLDGAKGPDIFIELVSRMPRHSYGACHFSGPDNDWSLTGRWSRHLLDLAVEKGVEATYEGVLSDAEVRQRVYRGRTVLVIPSRTDAFNYVSLEAVLNGCPVLVSENAGSLGFLRRHYPHLAPPSMHPDHLEAAAASLLEMLANYENVARISRKTLLDDPFPTPRQGFMEPIYYEVAPARSTPEDLVGQATKDLRARLPLLSPSARAWRHSRTSTATPRLTVIIPTLDRPEMLAPTLATVMRQTLEDLEVIVIDDGSKDAQGVRAVATAFPSVRHVRIGNAGEAAAVNRGIGVARGEFIGFLSDDDVYAPELLVESIKVLEREPAAIGTYPDWDIIDTSGHFVEAHRPPEFDRRLMLCAHWCLPGPGAVIRRNVLHSIGGRDLSFRFVSDFDLWIRATFYGPMIHLPYKLAYWRLHTSNFTNYSKRRQMADERILLIDRFFSDPQERVRSGAFRHTAYAAAHLAASAIIGKEDPQETKRHLREAARLDPDLVDNLPPNMAGYPALWPS
jgi:glycosyltransferase involved in cell wall biosynthesis